VPLERITPFVKKYDLGHMRLWQDDLIEIVRLVQQLPDAEVAVECDDNLFICNPGDDLLDVVRVELPKLGQRRRRVHYFTVTANQGDEAISERNDSYTRNLIRVRLTEGESLIEAFEPNLLTMGLIESIRSIVNSRPRLPAWLQMAYQNREGRPNYLVRTTAVLVLMAVLALAIVDVFPHNRLVANSAIYYGSLAVLSLFLLVAVGGVVQGRTLLFTATHDEAPTFWERKRGDIAIHVIVGLAFFLLGLLAGHL